MAQLSPRRASRAGLALATACTLAWSGCATPPSASAPAPAAAPQVAEPRPAETPAATAPAAGLKPIETDAGRLVPVDWSEVPDFEVDPLDDVHKSFRFSCPYLSRTPHWRPVCAQVAKLKPNDAAGLRQLLQSLQPYRLESKQGERSGPITGYYEPVLRGSRVARNPYFYPLYSRPVDLVPLDAKRGKGVTRGRREGEQVVPYWTRAQIPTPQGQRSMSGREIVWVDDPMDVILIEVQGSGRVALPDGTALRLSFADHNGHPYRPLSAWFRDKGELPSPGMLQIRQWARRNPPARVQEMLYSNPQVVFFRAEPVTDVTVGPRGASGAPVVPMRSLAVDPKAVPLGAPMYIEFASPLAGNVLNRRVVFGHDTGGAIKGPVRADFFWGFGEHAGEVAAKTRQNGRLWVFLPKP
ncbi:murein transglycosylase A [Caldimonas brevitalea]|uniref:peptidoglycan lytic exotransglycosylase n=1 Tax=Caldimonas brevitalea TaxID=413882 RepID=A0A0G3BHH8_9BURK|nr:MltA domain-containing protein [Caldimonas brevitalea]AKJ28889.1 membrane-bound lytic murein transglycosylase A [Caldimonas brevitalea]